MNRPLRRLPAVLVTALPGALAAAMLATGGLADRRTEEGTIATDDFTGRWLKATTDPCAERYPAELLLRPGGLYEAPGGPETGAAWHSGEWRLEGGTALVIQMADDEMRRYPMAASDGNELAVTDDEGCRIVYRRAPGPDGQG